MAKKKVPKIRRALGGATALALERPFPKPTKETVIIHTTREKKRNAGGGLLEGGAKKVLIPLIGGVAGGAATVFATAKLNVDPLLVAAGTAVAGVTIAATVKEPLIQQIALGAAIGAGTLGGLQLINQATADKPKLSSTALASKPAHRDANEEPITRRELNEALSKAAEKQSCDLTTALREEIKRAVADSRTPRRRPADRLLDPYRDASEDDEERNAYGEDDQERNAYGEDDYERNAYGEDDYERNAYGEDDYERNAYGEDDYERNADVDDEERNAFVDEDVERNASC